MFLAQVQAARPSESRTQKCNHVTITPASHHPRISVHLWSCASPTAHTHITLALHIVQFRHLICNLPPGAVLSQPPTSKPPASQHNWQMPTTSPTSTRKTCVSLLLAPATLHRWQQQQRCPSTHTFTVAPSPGTRHPPPARHPHTPARCARARCPHPPPRPPCTPRPWPRPVPRLQQRCGRSGP